jgi:phosphoribosylamine--glycine ligase
MGLEIERKFLVAGDFKPFANKATRIIQGYLSSVPERTVRVRIKDDKGFLTVKGTSSKSGTTRFEWEKEIPVGEAQELIAICESGVIDKTRYIVEAGRHIYEIDEFHGDNQGLIVAEIELASEDETFAKPQWLGKEVTGDTRYYNSMLMKNPYRNWKNKDTNHMKKALVIGGGGREHAIVDALSRSTQVGKIYCAPGNAGISAQAECVAIKDTDVESLKNFALENEIDLTVVGPEVALAAGVVDAFKEAGLRIFGPSKAAATIEASKDFAKQLMAKYNIPTAAFETFEDYDAALEYVKKGSFPVVLKYDGLAAGKGVVIPETLEEADATLKDMLLDDKFGKGKVVVEEFLTGPEFSFMCFVDGYDVYPMTLSQDHKRAYEGDKGPNTGGMGAYSPVPIISDEDLAFSLEKVMKPTAAAMVAEGCPFTGVLYGGLMKTPQGPKVIEFNCRFGDPETEVVLPRLESDIYDIFSAVADHTPMPEIKWKKEVTMGFVMASKGYPGSYEKGYEISGLDTLPEDIRVFHMGTSLKDGKYFTSGGRVLMVVGSGKDLQEAHDKALAAVESIGCENLFYRRDIGWRVL